MRTVIRQGGGLCILIGARRTHLRLHIAQTDIAIDRDAVSKRIVMAEVELRVVGRDLLIGVCDLARQEG